MRLDLRSIVYEWTIAKAEIVNLREVAEVILSDQRAKEVASIQHNLLTTIRC